MRRNNYLKSICRIWKGEKYEKCTRKSGEVKRMAKEAKKKQMRDKVVILCKVLRETRRCSGKK